MPTPTCTRSSIPQSQGQRQAGRDALPARACGRRAHHTRRYVTALIHIARWTDTDALERLRRSARQQAGGELLGLNALAEALAAPHQARAACA